MTYNVFSGTLNPTHTLHFTSLAGNAGPKKIAKNLPSGHHRTTLSVYVFATEERIDNRKKIC